MWPLLYLIYTLDLPTSNEVKTATFADDTSIMASHVNPEIATSKIQENLDEVQMWLKKLRIKVNEKKSIHVTFTLRKETCPPVKLNGQLIPQSDSVKYIKCI